MNKIPKNSIEYILAERELLLKKDSDNPNIDIFKDNILGLLKNDFNELEIDFILETLTKLGQAPCLVYDDNALFAVSGDGYQPVVTGRHKIEGGITVYVEKKQWKKTIREAVRHYLDN